MKKIAFFSLLMTAFYGTNCYANQIIHGSLNVESGCEKGEYVVWLSIKPTLEKKRNILLSHAFVPLGGTYAFYVKPGDYDIAATSSNYCLFEKELRVKAGEKKKVNIVMKQID